MALTYRSPIEEILGAYTTIEQSTVASTSLQGLKSMEMQNYRHFCYALSSKAKERLISSGIYLSPFSAIPHSHPVCKTLENHILYNVLPNYLDATFYLVGIKQNKIEFLRERKSSLNLIDYINRYVTSKDKMRYGSEFHVTRSADLGENFENRFVEESDALRTLIPSVITSKARKLFLHDELHYWSNREIITFLGAVKPEVLLATIVVPPEILAGSDISLNTWAYEFEIKKGRLMFYPDGVREEGYNQPSSSAFLLKAKTITLPDGEVYCVDILHSKFSHHLIAITKGKLVTDETRTFGNFEAISTHALKGVSNDIRSCYPISYEVVARIYMYLETLLKPDNQSAMAKLSQLVGKPTGQEIRFVQDFSRFVISTRTTRMDIMGEYGVKMVSFLAGMLPTFAARIFSSYREVTLQNFIGTLCPYTFKVSLVDLNLNYSAELFFLGHTTDINFELDLPDMIDDKFMSGEVGISKTRVSNEYTSTGNFEYIEVNGKHLQNIFFLNFVNNRVNVEFDYISLSDVREYLLRLKGQNFLCNVLLNNFGEKEYSDLYLRICRYLNRKRLTKFSISRAARQSDNFRWFMCRSRRFYSKFLCNDYGLNVDSHHAYKNICKNFGTLFSGIKLEVGRTEEVKFFNTKVSEIAKEKKEVVEEERLSPTVSEIEEEVFIRRISEKKCKCGLPFEYGNFQGAEFIDCKFPDILKNRRAGWYSKDGSPYSYTGGKHLSLGWPEWADVIIEANGWSKYGFNCFLAQRYPKNASIGFHADDEANIAKGSAILTLNLSGHATFKIRSQNCSESWALKTDEYLIMPPGCQESHKHSVSDTSDGRVSITFRVLAEMGAEIPITQMFEEIEIKDLSSPTEFSWENVNVRIEPGVDINDSKKIDVPGDGNCFWHSAGFFMGVNAFELKKICKKKCPKPIGEALARQLQDNEMSESEAIALFCKCFNSNIIIKDLDNQATWEFSIDQNCPTNTICLENAHYTPLVSKNDCVITCLVEAMNRKYSDIVSVLQRPSNSHILEELIKGEGLSIFILEEVFTIFGIRAEVAIANESVIMNPNGELKYFFKIEDDHIEYVKPSKWISLPALASNEVEQYANSAIRILEDAGTRISYVRSRCRAEALASSLNAGTTGAICSKTFSMCENLMHLNEKVDAEKSIVAVTGTFGAGKSFLFKEFINKSPGKHITFVSPRRNLADSVKSEIFGLKGNAQKKKKKDSKSLNWNVFTFEVFLKVCKTLREGQVVILDEIQLYPPGYLDLILFLMPESIRTYIVGDPCQSDYDSEGDRTIFLGVPSDIQKALFDVEYKYVSRSRRFKNANFVKRLPCDIQESNCTFNEPYLMMTGFEEMDQAPSEFKHTFLVSSFDEKKVIRAHYPAKTVSVLTFGESTGLTFKYGTVVITPSADLISEKRWVTSLSRFSDNLCLLNLSGNSFNEIKDMYANRTLSRFLIGKAEKCDLIDLLPGKPNFVDSFIVKIGKDKGVKEEKLIGDPYLKSMVFLGQTEDAEIVEFQEIIEKEIDFKTHLPRCELESVRARWVHKFMAKEDREVRVKGLVTDQFTDSHSKNHGKILTNAAERFENIYPRHRSRDTATFLLAVKKRLRFSRPAVEKAKLKEAKIFGEAMLKLFLSKIPMKSAHNKNFMEKAVNDFEAKKTSKSAATIANHSNRSCRDWLADVGLVFMKSQICTKFDNRFLKAKAAQSIVCFQHSVLCRFAPYMRYMEMKLNEVLPKRFYIHSGKSLDELNSWVKIGKFDGVCTESDYEAFDASQDQYIMAFELELMKYLGLPRDLIADYEYIKTHLGSKLGNFAIMRFSGEASTFLFNTMANMLFTFMRYDLTGNEYICFAGDDMCASKRLRLQSEHESYLNRLKLKAKVGFTANPTFCGWNLTPMGIYKKPQLVLERMCIAKETNNLINCIDNYALEVAYAYKMGEYATNRMSIEEVESHYNCLRIIIKNMHLIKSDAYSIFKKILT
nr:replicase [Carrot virus S]